MPNRNDPIRTPEKERLSILKQRHYGKASKPIVWWALGALVVLSILGGVLYNSNAQKQAGLTSPATTTGSAVPKGPSNIPAGSGTQRP
jgi:hypothetical protein